MGTAADLRDRLWRERLVTALRMHLPAELDEAEMLAIHILHQGIPPGQDESAVRAALSRVPAATPDWIEQVMRIVRGVRDGLRLSEPETVPIPESFPLAHAGEPERVAPFEALSTPSAPLAQRLVAPRAPEGAPPAMEQPPEPDLFMALVLERLRAVNQLQRLAPQVQGAQNSSRALRIAVMGVADDSIRLRPLLDEWHQSLQTWESQNQLLQAAQTTLRSTQWLLRYLQWPPAEEQIS